MVNIVVLSYNLRENKRMIIQSKKRLTRNSYAKENAKLMYIVICDFIKVKYRVWS